MLYTIEKSNSKLSCDQNNLVWNLWRYSLDYFKGHHGMTLSIGLPYFQEICVAFCPYFSNEPFTYQLSSTLNYIKIITTLVGIFLVLFSSKLINKFWILYSLIGFFVGGILWASTFIIFFKTVPKIPTRLKVQFLLGAVPFLTSTTYGIAIYFKYFFIASIFCFFFLGVIATYWYGEPSERSITLVSNAVKFFGVLLIVFAQSDHWPSVIFIVLAFIVLSSISFCLQTFNFCKQICKYLLIFLIKVKDTAVPNNKYKSEVLKPAFPLISKEEFELQYLNIPTYLVEIASAVRADPLIIRRIKRCNRADFALFCLDPEGYLPTKSDEINDSDLSDGSETTFYSDYSDHDRI